MIRQTVFSVCNTDNYAMKADVSSGSFCVLEDVKSPRHKKAGVNPAFYVHLDAFI
jgi:hypothetical protein